MIEQLNTAFEVISVDGSRAYFLDNTEEGTSHVFEAFEAETGLSRSDLEHAAHNGTSVFIPEDEKYFTVARIPCVA